MKIKRLSHVAIAGDDPEASRHLFVDLLGLQDLGSELVASEGVRTHFYAADDSNIEVLETLSAETAVGKFLGKRGPGLHHIAFEVEDLDAYVEKLTSAGIQLLSESPKRGAHDMRIIFIHPKSSGGVLIELSEKLG